MKMRVPLNDALTKSVAVITLRVYVIRQIIIRV